MHEVKLKGPTFICVGPEKTGTTWLFKNLDPHPDIFLAPVKEMCFFYESYKYPDESWLSRISIKGDWHTRRYRRYLIRRPFHYLRYPKYLFEPWRVIWDWRYLFAKHDNSWYLSSFELANSYLVTGEISPPYFFMEEKAIENISQLLPNVKIIIFLRNPIDWCWSFARMVLLKGKSIRDIPENDFYTFFETKFRYSKFAPTVRIWQKYFSPKQLYIGFYDRLLESPLGLHKEICDFLGVDQQKISAKVLAQLSNRVNQGYDNSLPNNFAVSMAQAWSHDIEELCQLFQGSYPQKWKHQMSKYINSK